LTRAVVFAYHDVGVRCLEALLDAGVEVALVVSHRDDPGENIFFGSVAKLAAARGITCIFPDDPNAADETARVRALQPDFLFSFYYRRMLRPQLLGCASRGAFNMHGSLLPKYRGRAPVNWAVLRGAHRRSGGGAHRAGR
jgi:methionyl-tRNA formyltransferase